MQSGYGVPETQQFMDGCNSSLLSISQEMDSSSQGHKHQSPQYLQLYHPQMHQQQHWQQRYFHVHHQMPRTQPFFQHHPYQLQANFQQQQQQQRQQMQLELDQDSRHEKHFNSPSPFVLANFKLAALDDGCYSTRNFILSHCDEPPTVRGEEIPKEHRQEDFSINWKPLDVERINTLNKRCREKIEKHDLDMKLERGVDIEEIKSRSSSSNYGLFGELEAIYTNGSHSGGNNQTVSGSALTGDKPPAAAAAPRPSNDLHGCAGRIDPASETSNGEEASLKLQNCRRKKREHLCKLAPYFEGVVKRLVEHQESLHNKFLEALEKSERERLIREEEWRREEEAKSTQEAIARAEEHALLSSREAAIVAFLKKISGEAINLHTKTQTANSTLFNQELHGDEQVVTPNSFTIKSSVDGKISSSTMAKRWPKEEVQALIRVRSSLERKFQEPGMKGPLWEQVSSSMAAFGYDRSAKRCKEKWENINKYFRKTKDNAKKRSQHSKTCSYFHQLQQLYSKSSPTTPNNPNAMKDNSKILDAISVSEEHGNLENPQLQLNNPQEFGGQEEDDHDDEDSQDDEEGEEDRE